jgi:hypothetical protein
MRYLVLSAVVLAAMFASEGCCCCRNLFGPRTEAVVAAPACPAPTYAPACPPAPCPPAPCATPYSVPPVTAGYAPGC